MNNKYLIIGFVVLIVLIAQAQDKKEAIKPLIAKGGGVVQTGIITSQTISQKQAISSSNILIGKYHEARQSGTSPASVPTNSIFKLEEYPLGYLTDGSFDAKFIGEPKSESKSEIPIVILNRGKTTSGGTIKMDWYHPDGRLVYSFKYSLSTPPSGAYYESVSIWSWLGYFEHEIDRQGLYKIEITSPWGNDILYYNVLDNSIPNNKCYSAAQCFDSSYQCIQNVCSREDKPDIDPNFCTNAKISILSLITTWINNPSPTAKSQILTRITDWAGKC